MSNQNWGVEFEVVNLETRKLERRTLISGVSYKTACALKRAHKRIAKSYIVKSAQQGAAPDAEAGGVSNVESHSN